MTANDELEYIPSLARSWELNADTTLLTLHLRDDVFWHDGLKTTAYDVAFSYDRYRDPETAYLYRDRFFPYGEGEAVDSFTFQVRLRPHADFLAIWVLAPPVPRNIIEDVPLARLRRHPFGTTQPIGNGPFRLVSRTPGQQWVFAASENFPEELGGRPHLDRVVYRVVPEPTTRLTELLTGRVDLVPISPFQLAQVEQAARVRAIPYRLTSTRIIIWNTRRPLFADERVRRALTMAIDRQGIIDGIAYGHGDIASSFFPPFFWAHDPAVGADLRYSSEAARRLLAEAGWEDRDGNVCLRMPPAASFVSRSSWPGERHRRRCGRKDHALTGDPPIPSPSCGFAFESKRHGRRLGALCRAAGGRRGVVRRRYRGPSGAARRLLVDTGHPRQGMGRARRRSTTGPPPAREIDT